MNEAEKIAQRINRQPSNVIKRQLQQATAKRDAVPKHDLQSWHFWNGRVIALQDVLLEFRTNQTPEALR